MTTCNVIMVGHQDKPTELSSNSAVPSALKLIVSVFWTATLLF